MRNTNLLIRANDTNEYECLISIIRIISMHLYIGISLIILDTLFLPKYELLN